MQTDKDKAMINGDETTIDGNEITMNEEKTARGGAFMTKEGKR